MRVSILSLLFSAFFMCGESEPQGPQPQALSLIALIARQPARGRILVRTEGFLSLKYEDTALYMDEESNRAHLFKNSIWVELSPDQIKACSPLSGHYVTVEGWFTKQPMDSQELFSGRVGHIISLKPLVGQAEISANNCITR